MEERTRQIVRNEALFRAVNEQVMGLNEAFATVSGEMTIVCECGDEGCIEQLDLPVDDYRDVRSDSELFVVKSGHQADEVEFVVSEHDGYLIVRKRAGEPARLARRLDTMDV